MPFKDAARIHLATGLFTCCLEKFSETVPPGEFKQLKPSLESQFDAGYMDGELLHIADDQVPPLDLRSVAAFRQGPLKRGLRVQLLGMTGLYYLQTEKKFASLKATPGTN